jgi:23S rRNA (pseudouridine1915-N3)-methyltransferase
MQIKILIIGKTASKEIASLIDDYQNRLKHYTKLEVEYIEPKKSKKQKEPLVQQEDEGELIIKRIDNSALLVLLDESGKQYTSVNFAAYLQKQLLSGKKELFFVIGGAYGFSEAVYQRADAKLSLSKMTFTHQMVRLIFIEQLYRAFTILKGEKYHH